MILVSPQAAPVTIEPLGDVHVKITGLRSTKGLVRVCMTRIPKSFPECKGDPASRQMSVAAAKTLELTFTDVPSGSWAIAVLHDENSNGKADKALMIPREGFGFSRDAPVRFGPPRYDDAAFAVEQGDVSVSIRMRYML
ncbi:DUF2141 domain-containing protein [Tsuneonella suprasediminis]|uniref:DUF2141 domain-containing protein n=1 Tax=Tsuneonella suprasediminis TaxID=2306996 RepID=UPI002F92E997